MADLAIVAELASRRDEPVALFSASRLLTEHWLTGQIAARHGVTWADARGALNNLSSMGLNGSDARFNVAAQSNPGGHMTNNAIRDVVPYVVGLRQAEVGLANFAGRYARERPGPNYHAEVQTQWNLHYDPRICTLMERGPHAFSRYVRSLPKAQANLAGSQYHPDGWAAAGGRLAGDVLATAPVAELNIASKLPATGKLATALRAADLVAYPSQPDPQRMRIPTLRQGEVSDEFVTTIERAAVQPGRAMKIGEFEAWVDGF